MSAVHRKLTRHASRGCKAAGYLSHTACDFFLKKMAATTSSSQKRNKSKSKTNRIAGNKHAHYCYLRPHDLWPTSEDFIENAYVSIKLGRSERMMLEAISVPTSAMMIKAVYSSLQETKWMKDAYMAAANSGIFFTPGSSTFAIRPSGIGASGSGSGWLSSQRHRSFGPNVGVGLRGIPLKFCAQFFTKRIIDSAS